jgi:hypothetical protein
MKVKVRLEYNGIEICIEANPRLRDFESTTNKIVQQAIKHALKMGIVEKVS